MLQYEIQDKKIEIRLIKVQSCCCWGQLGGAELNADGKTVRCLAAPQRKRGNALSSRHSSVAAVAGEPTLGVCQRAMEMKITSMVCRCLWSLVFSVLWRLYGLGLADFCWCRVGDPVTPSYSRGFELVVACVRGPLPPCAQDLEDLHCRLSRARNPAGFLMVLIRDIEKVGRARHTPEIRYSCGWQPVVKHVHFKMLSLFSITSRTIGQWLQERTVARSMSGFRSRYSGFRTHQK